MRCVCVCVCRRLDGASKEMPARAAHASHAMNGASPSPIAMTQTVQTTTTTTDSSGKDKSNWIFYDFLENHIREPFVAYTCDRMHAIFVLLRKSSTPPTRRAMIVLCYARQWVGCQTIAVEVSVEGDSCWHISLCISLIRLNNPNGGRTARRSRM